jgi:flavodoxin
MHGNSFLKKKPDETKDLFEGIQEKGTSSPKCTSLGSLMDSRGQFFCQKKQNELEKMSNSSSEFMQ